MTGTTDTPTSPFRSRLSRVRTASGHLAWPLALGVAAATMLSALGLTHVLWVYLEHTPFVVAFGATVLSTWIGGRRAGVLSVLVGVVGFGLLPPALPPAGMRPLLTAFAIISGSFCWLMARRLDAELALRTSESRLAEAQQVANVGSWDWNVADGSVVWSRQTFRIFAADPRVVTPSVDAFTRLVHPDDRAGVDAAITHALTDPGHQPFACDNRIVLPNGAIRSILVHGRPIPDAHGQVVRLIGTVQDISERKAAEERTARSEHRLRTILDAQPACVKLVSDDGRLLDMNPAGLAMIGATTTSEIVGRAVTDLIKPEDRERFIDAHRAASEGHAIKIDFRIIGFRGDERRVTSRMVPFEPSGDASSSRRHVLSVTNDDTERVVLEEQLRQAQKMEAVGRLAGGIAHDFNNLLTVIGGVTELVMDRVQDDPESAASLREVLNASQSAASLTRQLLLFGRKPVGDVITLDLNTVISSMRSMLRRVLGEDIEIDLDLAADLRPVNADPAQLQQVLMNLAVNARDAMPSGGSLVVRTSTVELDAAAASSYGLAVGPFVTLTVTDTGHGMDTGTKSRIFEPFFTTKDAGLGTGLGLSVVYGIVRGLDGAIAVDTEPGRGATFTIYLPASRATVLSPGGRHPPASPGPARGETILLVEDDDAVRLFVATVLRKAGYDVIEAASPEQALTRAATGRRVDVLVSDIVMPHMNGFELARRFCLAQPQTRRLFLSGYAGESIRQRELPLEGYPLLSKPFTADELLTKLRIVLNDDREPSIA